MGLKARAQKEFNAAPIMLQGYSRQMANAWNSAVAKDLAQHENDYDPGVLAAWHAKGYLSSGVKRYDLASTSETSYISDFAYLYLAPFNNSMAKWLEDILTTSRVLRDYADHLRPVYFSIIHRDGQPLILHTDHEDRRYTEADIIEFVKEKGELELRPAHWTSTRARYVLTFENGYLHIDGEVTGERTFHQLLKGRNANYVITDRTPNAIEWPGLADTTHSLKLWIANDTAEGSQILCAVMNLYWTDADGKRAHESALVDRKTGTYAIAGGKEQAIPGWHDIVAKVTALSSSIPQISFYTMSIALVPNKPFQILHFSTRPSLPPVAYDTELNSYLLDRFASKQYKRTLADRAAGLRSLLFERWVHRSCRKGIRPYMQRLWMEAVYSDLLHTKDVSLSQKLWSWKRGFLSYRTYQYGLTPDNYTSFLADYDYYWLNRINNDYQKWINDKTTYRLILEPYKDYLPKYYLSLFKRGSRTVMSRMPDCPAGITSDFNGLVKLLKQEKKLALKASAGTHGDGFYCLAYENDAFCINGEVCTPEQLQKVVADLDSFYVVTEYIDMHHDVKKIYAKSVNTIRMMVINEHGYDPKIMQTYMRIGSEKTGYTDNVGYGGICVMVDKETGELFQPETIKDHHFYPCPNHPDTGTPIAGFLPNWKLIQEKVLEISRYLCELEYLGYDIAITEDGFCILEINIHQDLHKAGTYDDEINDYFRRKIARKRLNNHLDAK